MRRLKLVSAIAVCAAGVLSTSANAVENTVGMPPGPGLSYDVGPTTQKKVWLIGDSLTNDWGGVQTNYDVFYLAASRWSIRVEATAGAKFIWHWSSGFNTFHRAAADPRMAVAFVELGTNDTSAILSNSKNYIAQRDLVNNYLTLTAEYLRSTKKCVVLMGVDATGNGAIDPVVGKWYNARVKALSTGYVHYADYNGFISTNAIYRSSVYSGGDHVHPKSDAAKQQLAIWIRDQIRWYCGTP